VIPGLLKGLERPENRKIAIIDGSGELFDSLNQVAEQRNSKLKSDSGDAKGDPAKPERKLSKNEEDDRAAKEAMGLEEIHRYVLEQ
ncbi:hypothetical protein ACI3PL_25885, partial [Lacticaseibacillus paracasei]